jgi:protein-disulfide isomerase
MPVRVDDHRRGTPQAPVTLEMCGDYECPYTRQAHHVVRRLLDEVPDELCFVFRHVPLTQIHPHTEHAAEATEAAAAQGMFWEMHETLFAHQRALEDADLRRYAAELELNAEWFARDLETHAYAPQIAGCLFSGVQGTPTLYFNGHLLADGYDEETLHETISGAGSSPHA